MSIISRGPEIKPQFLRAIMSFFFKWKNHSFCKYTRAYNECLDFLKFYERSCCNKHAHIVRDNTSRAETWVQNELCTGNILKKKKKKRKIR